MTTGRTGLIVECASGHGWRLLIVLAPTALAFPEQPMRLNISSRFIYFV